MRGICFYSQGVHCVERRISKNRLILNVLRAKDLLPRHRDTLVTFIYICYTTGPDNKIFPGRHDLLEKVTSVTHKLTLSLVLLFTTDGLSRIADVEEKKTDGAEKCG